MNARSSLTPVFRNVSNPRSYDPHLRILITPSSRFRVLRWASLQFVALLLVAGDMVGYDGPDAFEEGKASSDDAGSAVENDAVGQDAIERVVIGDVAGLDAMEEAVDEATVEAAVGDVVGLEVIKAADETVLGDAVKQDAIEEAVDEATVGDAVGDVVGMGDGRIASKGIQFLEPLIKMLGANMGKMRQKMLSGR
ncbi:hypothetical protein ASPCAL14476 [Aspergillus calidoustus]|uniref:Uncharacterized protein n=1 Tax=Aspergillus calidoustus TaxID=454130 RepID=A0A0U5GJE3_ASPCI|nr:hypothetical protein ASPCAL14476 [Aspergillus calidoustus]